MTIQPLNNDCFADVDGSAMPLLLGNYGIDTEGVYKVADRETTMLCRIKRIEPGDVVKMEKEGAILRVYVNGVLVCTQTDRLL